MADFKEISVRAMMLFGLIVIFANLCATYSYKPHVIIITADDIGYDDLKRGSAWTKYMDEISRYSVRLKNYYVMPNGHSTRSALLTGKHPAVLGTQFEVDDATIPYGLGTEHRILPQYLKELGYVSHAVGQWDLGFYSEDLLPTNRGYDSFYGSYLTHGDYKTHKAKDEKGHEGLDLHENTYLDPSEENKFKTDLYGDKAVEIIRSHDKTNPLHLYVAFQGAQMRGNRGSLCKSSENGGKIPYEYYRRLGSEEGEIRTCYLALVKAVDQQLGRIVDTLTRRSMLANSLVIFTTTSGGAAAGLNFNSASNFPLRGAKGTGWEGGVRGFAMVFTSIAGRPLFETDCLFHVTDWIPTILSVYKNATATDVQLPSMQPLYGVNQLKCIYNDGRTSNRFSVIHFLYGRSASIRKHRYKLIMNEDGHFPKMNEWYYGEPPASSCEAVDKLPCPSRSVCMYDLSKDPCEQRNIKPLPLYAVEYRDMMVDLTEFNKTVKYSTPLKADSRGDPANSNSAWQSWVESSTSGETPITSSKVSIILTTIAITVLLTMR